MFTFFKSYFLHYELCIYVGNKWISANFGTFAALDGYGLRLTFYLLLYWENITIDAYDSGARIYLKR